jgi:GDP-L-fucose synthase
MKVVVTGATGFLGSNLVPKLRAAGHTVVAFGREDFDLTLSDIAFDAFPNDADCVVHLAALVAGIGENARRPYDFFIDNVRMSEQVVDWCSENMVPLVTMGSACAYPVDAESPLSEYQYHDGEPERTNWGYAMAKRALHAQMLAAAEQRGLQGYHLIAANLYGPGDHYELDTAHVIPATISKMRANPDGIEVWGSPKTVRDFCYVGDCADAICTAVRFAPTVCGVESVNITSSQVFCMNVLMYYIASACNFVGDITYVGGGLSGSPERFLDNAFTRGLLLHEPTDICDGLAATVADYDSRR